MADLSDPAAVDTVVDRAVAELGGLDILVNNAGRGDWRPLADLDRGYFDAMLGLNLWAPLRLCQLAHPHLAAATDAAVVMIGSVDAVRPSAGSVVYGASKAGLAAATVALAKEWSDDAIRVTQVDPGIVDTPLASAFVPELEAAGFGVNIVRRAGTADEIAGLVHYLVSPLGRFATGVSFRVDGGAVAMGPFDTLDR
jgi:NAD(P)-dependent dehydrogenase (short-subunit alcohol dehydrogenase family)